MYLAAAGRSPGLLAHRSCDWSSHPSAPRVTHALLQHDNVVVVVVFVVFSVAVWPAGLLRALQSRLNAIPGEWRHWPG